MASIYSSKLAGPVALTAAGVGDGVIFQVPLTRHYVIKSLFLENIYGSGVADVRVGIKVGDAAVGHFLSASIPVGGSVFYNFHLALDATVKLVAYLAVARVSYITVSGFDFDQG